MRDFQAGFEGDGDVRDLAWFPAWVLTQRPGLHPGYELLTS